MASEPPATPPGRKAPPRRRPAAGTKPAAKGTTAKSAAKSGPKAGDAASARQAEQAASARATASTAATGKTSAPAPEAPPRPAAERSVATPAPAVTAGVPALAPQPMANAPVAATPATTEPAAMPARAGPATPPPPPPPAAEPPAPPLGERWAFFHSQPIAALTFAAGLVMAVGALMQPWAADLQWDSFLTTRGADFLSRTIGEGPRTLIFALAVMAGGYLGMIGIRRANLFAALAAGLAVLVVGTELARSAAWPDPAAGSSGLLTAGVWVAFAGAVAALWAAIVPAGRDRPQPVATRRAVLLYIQRRSPIILTLAAAFLVFTAVIWLFNLMGDSISIDTVVQGVLLGGRYALFAAGLALIFGVMRLVNLAHGDLIVLAGFLMAWQVTEAGVPVIVAIAITLVFMGIIGYALQRSMLNRALASNDLLVPLLVTFGIVIIVQNGLQLIFSVDPRRIRTGAFDGGGFNIGGITIGLPQLVSIILAVAVLAALSYLFYRTRWGRLLRATSDSAETAQLMGINPRRIYALAMTISFLVIVIAAFSLASQTNVYPTDGPLRLLYAFEAVVIGGLGSLWGTLAGGIIIGLAQTIGGAIDPAWQQDAGHLVFVVLLLLRPRGLFPKQL